MSYFEHYMQMYNEDDNKEEKRIRNIKMPKDFNLTQEELEWAKAKANKIKSINSQPDVKRSDEGEYIWEKFIKSERIRDFTMSRIDDFVEYYQKPGFSIDQTKKYMTLYGDWLEKN